MVDTKSIDPESYWTEGAEVLQGNMKAGCDIDHARGATIYCDRDRTCSLRGFTPDIGESRVFAFVEPFDSNFDRDVIIFNAIDIIV